MTKKKLSKSLLDPTLYLHLRGMHGKELHKLFSPLELLQYFEEVKHRAINEFMGSILKFVDRIDFI